MDKPRTGRVVVTGHRGSDHASVVYSDQRADAVPLAGPAAVAHFLWGHDDPSGGEPAPDEVAQSPLPAPGGCRVSYLTLAPGPQEGYHTFIQDTFADQADPERPGFHHTPTVDIVVLLNGKLRLELEEGTVDLEPGDAVIQNGTNHRWSNVGDDDVVIATVMLGTHRSGSRSPAQP